MTRRLDGAPPVFVYRVIGAIRRSLTPSSVASSQRRVALFEQFSGIWVTQIVYAEAEARADPGVRVVARWKMRS
jgi:hypothetical protein